MSLVIWHHRTRFNEPTQKWPLQDDIHPT